MRLNFLNTQIEWLADGTATVTQDSVLSGKRNSLTLKMTKEQYDDWAVRGHLIQRALPHLSASEREFLLSGITMKEWDDEFNNEATDNG